MRFKAIILDFDGTIIESVGIKNAAFEELFKEYPRHIDEIMQYHLSHNAVIRYEKFRYIFEEILHLPYTNEIKERLSSRFSRYCLERITKCLFVNGAKEFLDYFYLKLPLYVISINPPDELEEIINTRGLTKYFKKIYSGPIDKTGAIREIVTLEALSNKEVIFIGDAPEDYKSAQEAGVFFVARSNGRSFTNVRIPQFKDLACIKSFLTDSLNC